MIFRSSMIVSRKNSVPLHLISFNSVQQYGKSRLHLYRHQWRRVCRRQGLDAAIRLCSGDRGTVRTRELRPMWKQLISSLERGDELVVSRFSNALRGTRELATFIEYCRVKVVRIISIQDRIDTFDELFPDTKPSQVIRMFGSLSEECAVLRKASAHIIHLQQNIRPPKKSERALSKLEREKNIVNMYNEGHSIDDIFAISGFTSRSSVFRILNKHGVTLNRGPHSGPLKKRNKE